MTPHRASDLRVEDFCGWLREQGAVIGEPTNEWEVLRYKMAGETHIVWQRKTGAVTWTSAAQGHYEAFSKGDAWTPRRRPGGKHRRGIVAKLLERDGTDCCFCGKPLGEDVTLEHFLPVSIGGTNHPSNCALAHHQCNQMADDLPIVEKIALRDRLTSEPAP